MGNFLFFARRKITDACLLAFFSRDGGGASGEIVTWEDIPMAEFFIGKDNLPRRQRQNFQDYLRKDQELHEKEQVFQLKVRSNFKT